MELGGIVQFLENKTILITGATGFLAKIFLEKILRVQPNVKKLYLLLRAADAKCAAERLSNEIIGKDLFRVLREKHGSNLSSLVAEKITVVAGDISLEDLGVKDSKLRDEMCQNVDAIVNFAATTNFDERAQFYGWPNTYVFTKAMGEMVLGHLKDKLPVIIIRPTMITGTYKEPFPGWIEGIKTIDGLIATYGKGKLTFFISPKNPLDVIPADMVVNGIIVGMVARTNHDNENLEQQIYHLGSSLRNPLKPSHLHDFTFRYFTENPWINRDGKPVKIGRGTALTTMATFRLYLVICFVLPLMVLNIVNMVMFQKYQDMYMVFDQKIKLVMRLVELYRPYIFFEGIFDDTNSEKLRKAARETSPDEADAFNFDPKTIDWEDYITGAHIPGFVKYAMK